MTNRHWCISGQAPSSLSGKGEVHMYMGFQNSLDGLSLVAWWSSLTVCLLLLSSHSCSPTLRHLANILPTLKSLSLSPLLGKPNLKTTCIGDGNLMLHLSEVLLSSGSSEAFLWNCVNREKSRTLSRASYAEGRWKNMRHNRTRSVYNQYLGQKHYWVTWLHSGLLDVKATWQPWEKGSNWTGFYCHKHKCLLACPCGLLLLTWHSYRSLRFRKRPQEDNSIGIWHLKLSRTAINKHAGESSSNELTFWYGSFGYKKETQEKLPERNVPWLHWLSAISLASEMEKHAESQWFIWPLAHSCAYLLHTALYHLLN